MARFYGKIGFGDSVEAPSDSGVWEDIITEFDYTGDVVKDHRNLQLTDQVLPNITVNNSISIVADHHAMANYLKIRYIEWQGVRWVVSNVQVQPPRLILSLGSVYNGPTS